MKTTLEDLWAENVQTLDEILSVTFDQAKREMMTFQRAWNLHKQQKPELIRLRRGPASNDFAGKRGPGAHGVIQSRHRQAADDQGGEHHSRRAPIRRGRGLGRVLFQRAHQRNAGFWGWRLFTGTVQPVVIEARH